MAEFQEIIKIRERMCEEQKLCESCPLDAFKDCKIPSIGELEEYEKTIMKWAAAHPEPQYPSWAEWKITIFQNCICTIHLCNFAECPFDYPSSPKCEKCENTPIPADIAEKLGIKPRKVSE